MIGPAVRQDGDGGYRHSPNCRSRENLIFRNGVGLMTRWKYVPDAPYC